MRVACGELAWFLRAVAALGLLLSLSACDFVVQPIGGVEGRTQVYVALGKQGAPNAGIVCTRIGAIVIDPMLSPALGNQLNAQAEAKEAVFWQLFHKQRGENPRTLPPPVLYVLNTTWRGNHTFGNQSFEKADVISTVKAKARLEAEGWNMREELRDIWKVPGLEAHAVTPATLTTDGTLNLDTPDVKVQLVSMGDCVGEGDAVVYLPGQKVLFAGDLVNPGFVPYYKGRTQTMRAWIDALKKLEGWEIETVVPGHGELGKKSAITTQREFLEALVAETQKALQSGQTLEQAASSVRLPAYARWVKYDEWIAENVKLVYRELQGGKR